MRHKLILLMSVIFLISILSACGDSDVEGILLEVNDGEVLLSQGLTFEKYDVISGISTIDLQKEDVWGERESLNLMWISYDKTDEFEKGNQVSVWLTGDIMDSYPIQAEASKIEIE